MTGQNNTTSFFLLLCLTLFLPFLNHAQEVRITGQAPEYKDQKLVFYTYSDWITQKTHILGETHVNDTGYFECSFNLHTTQKIFSDLGAYKAYLFTEPGKNYTVVLPEKNPKTKAQELNPYFEGIPYHIGIKNTSENKLNQHIYNFLKDYNRTITHNIKKIYASRTILDSLIRFLDTRHTFENQFFQVFKNYKLGELRATINNGSAKLKKQLFNDSALHYYNPPYMSLFNKAFSNYFKDYYASYGSSVLKAINYDRKLDSLDAALKQDTLIANQEQLRELIMLKALHDGFYSNNFSGQTIIDMVDTLQKTGLNKHHRTIAQNIHEKITRLRKGYEPPDFCLYDRDSNLVCLDSLKGNYLYLAFCNSMNYTCLRHYKILDNLYEKHKNHFRILVISTEKDEEVMNQYFNRRNHPWKVLHFGNQPNILKEYNVKVMPAYYFIGPEGKLLLSPAPSPSEKIEWEIFKQMRRRGDL
jgi:peroxiredoxin